MQMMLHERTGTAFGVAGGIYRAEGVPGFWRGNGALFSTHLHVMGLRQDQCKVEQRSEMVYLRRIMQTLLAVCCFHAVHSMWQTLLVASMCEVWRLRKSSVGLQV